MVDTLGLLLAVVVHGVDWQDQHGAKWVMDKLGEQFCRLQVIFGDSAYGRLGLPERVRETFGWVTSRCEEICRPAEALDRRTYVRLVGALPPLRENHRLQRSLYLNCHD